MPTRQGDALCNPSWASGHCRANDRFDQSCMLPERSSGTTMSSMALRLSQAERDYLDTQRLGRLATVADDGQPQNNPVGFFVNDELGVIDIGGRAMGQTKKFRNVQANPLVSLVVDDLASVKPWHVRGVEIRGHAEARSDWQPPYPGYSREAIRIHPARVISWGLNKA